MKVIHIRNNEMQISGFLSYFLINHILIPVIATIFFIKMCPFTYINPNGLNRELVVVVVVRGVVTANTAVLSALHLCI
jgi:hypothetical protein